MRKKLLYIICILNVSSYKELLRSFCLFSKKKRKRERERERERERKKKKSGFDSSFLVVLTC